MLLLTPWQLLGAMRWPTVRGPYLVPVVDVPPARPKRQRAARKGKAARKSKAAAMKAKTRRAPRG